MMIDLELKYCPKCRDEYYPQVENCAACNIRLVTGGELKSMQEASLRARNGEITADDDIVIIHKAPLQDIKRLEEIMKRERIGVLITGEEGAGCGKSCKKGCSTEYLLLVKREDAQDAFRIIEEEYRKFTCLDSADHCHADSVFDPNMGEAVCPACGERFSTTAATCPACGLCFG